MEKEEFFKNMRQSLQNMEGEGAAAAAEQEAFQVLVADVVRRADRTLGVYGQEMKNLGYGVNRWCNSHYMKYTFTDKHHDTLEIGIAGYTSQRQEIGARFSKTGNLETMPITELWHGKDFEAFVQRVLQRFI